MMKPLRKRHLQTWSVLALLLPAGIVFAWLSIPNQQPVKLLQAPPTELLPVIKQTSDLRNYMIRIRSNQENTAWQLEWKNKTILTVPSAVIYIMVREKNPENSFDPEKAVLVGRIESVGDYFFPITVNQAGFKESDLVLYDFIHEKIIDRITIQP